METRRKRGFTIIEMMLTIVVAMIVLGFGVPNFLNLIRSNETVTEVNNLATALNLARSEAVGRGVEVIITPQAGNDWTSGWVVGVDPPPLKWSARIVRKRRIRYGNQTSQAGRDCH